MLDNFYNVKLVDFGSSAFMPKYGQLFDTFAGTIQYCPPEILQGEKYSGPEQEVWSLGILLFTMLFAEPPFTDPTQIVHAKVNVPRGCECSKQALHLLLGLLHKRPSERMTISQILQHPWLHDQF